MVRIYDKNYFRMSVRVYGLSRKLKHGYLRKIDRKNIKDAISKLSNKSGPGPDGVPPHCYKNGGEFILDMLEDLTRLSLHNSDIPD